MPRAKGGESKYFGVKHTIYSEGIIRYDERMTDSQSPRTITVHVIPKARKVAIQETEGGETFKIHVTAVPEDGKANKAVIELLAKHLGIPKSRFSVIRGETSRIKTIRID